MNKSNKLLIIFLTTLQILLGCQIEGEEAVDVERPSQNETSQVDKVVSEDEVDKRVQEEAEKLKEQIFNFEAVDIEKATHQNLPHKISVRGLENIVILSDDVEEEGEYTLESFRITEDHFMFVYVKKNPETDESERVTIYLEKIAGEENNYIERETGTQYISTYP